MEKLNRIKGALADAGKTNIWLAEKVGRDPVTVSKWCTNTSQPDLAACGNNYNTLFYSFINKYK